MLHTCLLLFFINETGSVSLEILRLAFKRQIILVAVCEPGLQESQHHCWDEVSFTGSNLQTTLWVLLGPDYFLSGNWQGLIFTTFARWSKGNNQYCLSRSYGCQERCWDQNPKFAIYQNMTDFSTDQPHRHGNKTVNLWLSHADSLLSLVGQH